MFFQPEVQTVRFELTNICNLRCRMCGIWEERPNIVLDVDLYDRLLRAAALRWVRVISITGGEPFALQNLVDYYRLARSRHRFAHINFSTNGWYTDETVRLFETVRPRNTSVTISYDGLRSHDAVRRVGGSAERLLATATAIKQRFPRVALSLKMTVTSNNHEEITETAQQCRSLGIPFRFKTLEKLNCHQGRFPSEIDGPDYSDEITRSITRQAREVLKLGIETNSGYLEKLIEMNSSEQGVSCNCSPRVLFVGVDGKVFLCRRKSPIGSLRTLSLDEIWQSTDRRQMLASMSQCSDTLVSLSYSHH